MPRAGKFALGQHELQAGEHVQGAEHHQKGVVAVKRLPVLGAKGKHQTGADEGKKLLKIDCCGLPVVAHEPRLSGVDKVGGPSHIVGVAAGDEKGCHQMDEVDNHEAYY